MGKWRKLEGQGVEAAPAVVLVAVDGAKEITDYALDWAAQNVVGADDTLILLAVVSLAPSGGGGGLSNSSGGVPQFFSTFFKKLASNSGNNNKSNNEQNKEKEGHGQQHQKDKDGDREKEAMVMNRINESCSEMMNDLCSKNRVKYARTQVKLVPHAHLGAVADSALEHRARWVILDRRLKKEGDNCLKRLDSNIILIDHGFPKIIQLRRGERAKDEQIKLNYASTVQGRKIIVDDSLSSASTRSTESFRSTSTISFSSNSDRDATPPKPQVPTPSYFPKYDDAPQLLDVRVHEEEEELPKAEQLIQQQQPQQQQQQQQQGGGGSSVASRAAAQWRMTTSTQVREDVAAPEKGEFCAWPPALAKGNGATRDTLADVPYNSQNPNRSTTPTPTDNRRMRDTLLKKINENRSATPPGRLSVDSRLLRIPTSTSTSTTTSGPINPLSRQAPPPRGISQRTTTIASSNHPPPTSSSSSLKPRPPVERTSSVRRAISLSMKQPSTPPPLCSVCKYAAPVFGKPPRRFSYQDIEKATEGFAAENYLAEGGYGPVYRGVLEDGQVVAVKKHRKVSAQGVAEFCSEVELLSCAQHRNLVMLVGYCMEEDWLLVYEFACNGSLDKHLYGNHGKEVMEWHHRQKVAVGAARGLRYLHEDCRVGCIVHRDLRPNNILLTHDYEPMVGDFGLARSQANGQSAEETRIVGTFGYLAPEYTQTGQITEKADVYAFGVALLELVCGVKAIDLARGTGQQYLPQWARSLMEMNMMHELIDPRLNGNYVNWEVERMLYASSLCILQDPDMRPRMSKVLRILEGDMPNGYSAPMIQHQYLSAPMIPIPSFHAPTIPSTRPSTRPSMYHPLYQGGYNNPIIHPNEFRGSNTIFRQRPTSVDENLDEDYKEYLQDSLEDCYHNSNGPGFVRGNAHVISSEDPTTPRCKRFF